MFLDNAVTLMADDGKLGGKQGSLCLVEYGGFHSSYQHGVLDTRCARPTHSTGTGSTGLTTMCLQSLSKGSAGYSFPTPELETAVDELFPFKF